jgi:atypical dual specificity phosphatase
MGGEWPAPHLDWLESRGVAVLINLTERQYRDARFRIHHIPVPDGASPEETQITRFCLLVRRELAAGHTVYAHCLAGCGRTGTMMACYLIYREHLEPRAAIARVRAARRCSVETDAQEAAVTGWARLMQVTGYRLATT